MRDRNKIMNNGISMILVLWIITILTVLATATALMTTTDISSTLNLMKRRESLQLAESASEYVISLIPDNTMLQDSIYYTDSIVIQGTKKPVYKSYSMGTTKKSYLIAPAPIVYNSASGVNPYGPVSLGGSGSHLVFEFQTAGMVGTSAEGPQKSVDVAASFWLPLGESSFGHTMY